MKRSSLSINQSLLLLFTVNIGVSIVNSYITPLWPIYLGSLGATIFEVSLVASIINFVDTSLRAVSGLGSDIYGRRLFIVTSSFMSSIALFLYPLANSWQNLVPFAMIYAASFSFFMPARTAYVADFSPPKLRAKIYSMMNASWPIGSILGPIIGGIVQEWFGWRYAFYVASLISATTLLPAMMLKESNHARTNTKLGIGNLRPVIPFFVLNFLTGFGMGATSAIIPIYVQILFRTTPTELGLFFSIGSGVAMLLAQFPASWLPTKYGRRKTLLASQSVLPLMFLLWPFVGEYSALLLIYMIINGFWSITWPSSLSLLMGSIEPERRGMVAGLAQTTLMLGFSMGPLLGGVLWEEINPAAPFFASALILALSLPTIYGLRSLKTSTA